MVGFIIKEINTMHGHMKVKKVNLSHYRPEQDLRAAGS
jgi:hypothetical protein